MVRMRFIIKRLPCKWDCKGSLLFSNSTYLLKFICVRRPNCVRRRHLNYDLRLNCGCRPNSNCGFRCSCCYPNCGLNSKRNSSKANCSCCNCRLMNCCGWTNCFCCNCRCCFCLRPKRTSAKKKILAGAHIPNSSATDGCCWARCSFGVRRSGYPCGLNCCPKDGWPKHCPCGRWHCPKKDGCLPWDGCLPKDG